MLENNISVITKFNSAVINLQCCYQIAVSMDHPFECQLNGNYYSNIHGIIINKRQSYQASTNENTTVLVGYFEDDTTLGDAIRNKLNGKDILTLDKGVSAKLINEFLPDLDDSIKNLIQNTNLFYAWLLFSDYPNIKFKLESNDPRITAIMKYISQNLKSKITLKDIAAIVYLSVDRTRHLFLEETGTTLRQYILWKRVQQTVYKVLHEQWILSDACILCGFNNIAHFSRIFKNMFGIPPKQTLKDILFLSMPDIYTKNN